MAKYTNDYLFERRRPGLYQEQRSERNTTPDPTLYGKVRSYRGIPDTIDDKLGEIASEMKIPVGELVRAFLEYAIAAHNTGELMLNPIPRVVRSQRSNTLYPVR